MNNLNFLSLLFNVNNIITEQVMQNSGQIYCGQRAIVVLDSLYGTDVRARGRDSDLRAFAFCHSPHLILIFKCQLKSIVIINEFLIALND
jgi:hypothetical protein